MPMSFFLNQPEVARSVPKNTFEILAMTLISYPKIIFCFVKDCDSEFLGTQYEALVAFK